MSIGTINKALKTRAAQNLLRFLRFTSTDKQIENGTIVLEGYIGSAKVQYKVTATGVLMSNDFVIKHLYEQSEAAMYTAGLKAAYELFQKRFESKYHMSSW